MHLLLHLLSAMLIVIVLSSTEFLIFWLSFECILVVLLGIFFGSPGAFFYLCTLEYGGFLLLINDAFFTLSPLSFIAIDSRWTLHLALGKFGMPSVAVFVWALTKFSYSSFGVCFSDISCGVSKFCLTVVHIHCLYHYWLVRTRNIMKLYQCVSYFYPNSGESLLRRFCDLRMLFQKEYMPHSIFIIMNYLSFPSLPMWAFTSPRSQEAGLLSLMF